MSKRAESRRYVAPPPKPTERRVYLLPVDMVDGIHAFGQAAGCQSEVEAVRILLDQALKARGF